MSHTGGESDQPEIEPYAGPAGGWGSVKSVEGILAQAGRLISGNLILLKQNKPDGVIKTTDAENAVNARSIQFQC